MKATSASEQTTLYETARARWVETVFLKRNVDKRFSYYEPQKPGTDIADGCRISKIYLLTCVQVERRRNLNICISSIHLKGK